MATERRERGTPHGLTSIATLTEPAAPRRRV